MNTNGKKLTDAPDQRMKDKRLLVLADTYLTFIKDPVERLSSEFEQITVIVRHNPISELSRLFPVQRLIPFRRDKLVDLKGLPPNVSVLFAPVLFAPIDREYRALGARYLRSVRKVLLAHRIRFDLIHAHFVWPNGYVATRLGTEFNTPVVVTAHGYDIYDLPFRDIDWKRRIHDVLKQSDGIITISRRTEACVNRIDSGLRQNLIPNGFRGDLFFPMDALSCRRQLRLPGGDTKIILTVGNLVPEKGQRFLLEAVAELHRRGQRLVCVVIGMGELHHDLQKLIRSLGIQDLVVMPGWIPHDQLRLWINACDLFVFPSLSESFGLVQIEAMACGKPVVATVNGGSEEIVTSDEVGLLVPPGDAGALAVAILKALHRPWNNGAIIAHSEKYRWEVGIKKILDLYDDVLRRRMSSGQSEQARS